jgi:putative endonuclease
MTPAADSRKSLGRLGEDAAVAYLEEQGYTLVARNWRTRTGELDVIARDGEWLVFVEVRARRAAQRDAAPHFGTPADSVTPRKQLKLAAMAEAYLFEIPYPGPWRIDVVALELDRNGAVVRLEHYRDAVGG